MVDVGKDKLSKVVVQDEAKSQDYVIFMAHFHAVDPNDHLCVPQCILNLFSLVSDVHQLCSEGELRVPIEHEEASQILPVARRHMVYSHPHFDRLIHVKGPEQRRCYLFPSIMKRKS